MNEVADKIRRICARLLDVPENSPEAARYRSELKAAATQLALKKQEREWNKFGEGDKHQDQARQNYRSREKDSADAFAEGLKLFNPKEQDSKHKKKE
jgi:hypothetical protein